jgi:hypothetical protein
MSFAALLINIQIARASTDLYTSRILSKGNAYVTFDVARSHSSNSFQTAGISGTQRLDLTSEGIGLSYGLGNSWQAGLDFTNNSSFDLYRNYDNGQSSVNTTIQGQQNSGLWAKYGFVDDMNSPFSLAGVLKVVSNFTGKAAGFVIASLSGGWNFGDGLSGFTSYTGQFPQNSNNSVVNTISVSASKAVTRNFTLNPIVHYSKIEANDLRYATHQYGAGLTAMLRIGHNSYLQSTVSAFLSAPQNSLDGKSYWGEVHGSALSVGIYRLF